MNSLKILIIIFFFIFTNKISHANLIEIKVKIQDEIITNIDIENEKKYLSFLNPKLKELEEEKIDNIAKNSLITEIIKKKELKKIYDFKKNSNLIDAFEKNLLLKKNINNRDDLIKILNQNKIKYQTIRDKLTVETLWNQLVYKKYLKNVVTDREALRKSILQQFNNKKKRYTYNLSEIVIEEGISNNFDKEILQIKKSINEIGFENTANIYSISGTSKNGGLIGWINELQISEEINKDIKDLKISEVSEPIKIKGGYILIRVNNKRELKQQINLEDELEKVINLERNRQLNNFSIIFYKRLKKNIEINEY